MLESRIKRQRSLFGGASEAIGCSRMKHGISFQPLAARNSLKWMMNANFVYFMRSVWPQTLLLMLWVKTRRVVMWFESVAGTTNKASPRSRVS